jgi:hypothetical protein
MMTLKQAREIWKYYDMSEEELKAWVWTVNNRPPDPPDVHKGETIEVIHPHPPGEEEVTLKSST